MRSRLPSLPPRRPTGRRPMMREMRDEAGVIAIIVALSISTFLLGFAALAVDLGTAYVRKAELKSLAEKVALAGAAGLPTVSDSVSNALASLGTAARGGSPGTGLCASLDLPGVCDATGNWARDGNDANGEITFYAAGQDNDLDDANGDGTINALDQVSGTADAVGIHVLLPPSTVPFGLAQVLGFDSASLQSTATARIGTPLGAGILPFALTPVDLTNGQFCTQDPALAPGPGADYPGASGFYLLTATPRSIDPDVPNQIVTVTVGLFGIPGFAVPNQVTVHWQTGQQQTVRGTRGVFKVALPDIADPGAQVRVWAQWGHGTTTVYDTITFSGQAPSGVSPCSLPQANRGFVQLARSDPGDTLEPNIRTGPEVKLYPTGGLMQTIGTTLGCASTTLSSPVTTCLVPDLTEPFGTRMTDGFFASDGGRPGRLIGDCGGGTVSPHGNPMDDTALLANGSPLVDSSFGSASQLRTDILAGSDPGDSKQGWIRAQAFKCPRLAVMPVLDPSPLTTVLGGQNITKLEYVWIDDDGSGRGLAWSGSNLRSFRGYVVDPKYLPDLVAGSPVVGPYLGNDMPKEALLIPDFS